METTLEGLEKFSRVVEQTADSVMITRRDGVIEYVNPAFEKITGYTREEVIGKTPRILKSGSYPREYYEGLWETILSGQAFRSEVMNKKKSGEFFYWEQTITPIRNGGNEITHFVSTAKDVTERQKIEELKDQIIRIAAHELRSPLMTIQEGIAFVLEGTAGSLTREQRELLTISSNSIRRLNRTADNLLDLSKIEAGRMEMQRVSFDLGEWVEEIASSFKRAAAQKGIEIKTSLPNQAVQIFADRDRIGEVLTNLIHNAIKFTEQGFIEVLLVEYDGRVECSVSDTGRGISAGDLPQVFGKFQRFGTPLTGSQRGTGLGLAISKSIIELHGGKMWVESKPGQGSRFTFSLPKSYK